MKLVLLILNMIVAIVLSRRELYVGLEVEATLQ
jgi:hypothetical protein